MVAGELNWNELFVRWISVAGLRILGTGIASEQASMEGVKTRRKLVGGWGSDKLGVARGCMSASSRRGGKRKDGGNRFELDAAFWRDKDRMIRGD